MKKIWVIFTVLSILAATHISPVQAISESQSEAIQELLDETSKKSGETGLSLSIVDGDEVIYFSSGYANRKTEEPVTKDTLFELASVSKAFTGLGILLLEEQGFLSMTDPIQTYLPWLSFEYEGSPIDMQSVTLNNFLHHTSGLTNELHFQDIPQGNSQDMLLKTVEGLKTSQLQFLPSQQYQYGTVNYDVLGLVIEVVTNKSYERFMSDEVFQPLDLNDTYLYQADAQETGQMAKGYRPSFFMTIPYGAPDFAGNKPAGYIISNSKDMARWMKIQMGQIEDIPDNFKRIIEKSHKGNESVSADDGLYYGAGWLVNSDASYIEHDGVNPNFSTQVVLFPEDLRAVSLLTNSTNVNNIYIIDSVQNILEGKPIEPYQRSGMHLTDIIFSSATIIFTVLALLFFMISLRRERNNNQNRISKKRKAVIGGLLALTIIIAILSLIYPMFIGYDWQTLLVWQPYSLVTALLSLTAFCASFTWYIWKYPKIKPYKKSN